MVRSTSTTSSRSDADAERALEQRFGGDSDADQEDAENVLTALSINISPGKKTQARAAGGGGKTPYHGGPSKRSGRHSVAADVGTGPMTLRDQEQVSIRTLCCQTKRLEIECKVLLGMS
jgi:hypothetical protein